MKGLYICKTYWKNVRTGRMFPVLKYGKTKNIDKRLEHYNKNATYKLLAFFPCSDFLDERESYIHRFGYFADDYRLTRSEHIIFNTNDFKKLYEDVLHASTVKIKRKKIKNIKGEYINSIQF
jgi:hypothetical protein